MSSSSAPVVTFANAPALVIAYLKPLVSPLVVKHDVPNPRPDTFIRVLRTGGSSNTGGGSAAPLDLAQLTVESWAPDSDTAEANAQTVRHHINNLVGLSLSGHAVYKVVELSGPGELPDPLSNSRRSTWSVQVWIRGL